MFKTIIFYLSNKGSIIGIVTALLKIMLDIRTGKFKWIFAITDLIAIPTVAYAVFKWASESESLARWQVTALTIVISVNTFLAIKLITDPTTFKKIINSYFKINLKK